LVHHLRRGEKILADGGYCDGNLVSETPTGYNNDDQAMKHIARARHETINGRLKSFSVLSSVFRHRLELHGKCFHFIAILIQMMIENEECIFQVDYDDEP
jgi:hypothetical protein